MYNCALWRNLKHLTLKIGKYLDIFGDGRLVSRGKHARLFVFFESGSEPNLGRCDQAPTHPTSLVGHTSRLIIPLSSGVCRVD